MSDSRFDATKATIMTGHKHSFMVCCFYTDNYHKYAMALKESLDKFGLNYCLQKVENRGHWEANTRIKPEFLLDCLHRFQDMNLLYLDADAVVKKPLDYFDDISEDLAIYTTSKAVEGMSHDFLTGTIFIKNNPMGKLLLEKWVQAQSNAKQTQVDQDSIETAIYQLQDKISILPLPLAYIKIFDTDMAKNYDSEIYIEQYQASRGQTKLRRKRIRQRNRLIGAIVILLVVVAMILLK